VLAQCLQHCVNSDNWALEASAGVGRRVAEREEAHMECTCMPFFFNIRTKDAVKV